MLPPDHSSEINKVKPRSNDVLQSGKMVRLLGLLVILPLAFSQAGPVPNHGRNGITLMATADFAGAYELNSEGSRGWSVLKTYSDRVKRNRRNASRAAYLFHTGDLTGLTIDPHAEASEPVEHTTADGARDASNDHSAPGGSETTRLLNRKGVDLLQYTGFDAVAIRTAEQTRLTPEQAPGALLRFESLAENWNPDDVLKIESQRILTGPNSFVWITAVEPASNLESLQQQIHGIRNEIYRNRAADALVILFALQNSKDTHDEMEPVIRLDPLKWLHAFTADRPGNVFHPSDPQPQDFPYSRVVAFLPGKRAFFRTTSGITICRIPAGEICQVEIEFKARRKSITQHWIGFQESMRNHAFLPADPGMQKILR